MPRYDKQNYKSLEDKAKMINGVGRISYTGPKMQALR